MRRLLVLSTLTALAVTPLASADPTVGLEDGAEATFVLRAAGGTAYQIRLVASRPTQAGTGTGPMLRLHLTGGRDVRLSGPVTSLVTGSQARLSTRIGGVPLTISWSGSSSIAAVSYAEGDSDSPKAAGWTTTGNGGTARVDLGGVRCVTDSVVVGTVTSSDTEAYGVRLATGLGLSLRGLTCGAPGTTSYPLP